MKTKLNFLWMLLALLVGGVNGAWADRGFVIFNNGMIQSTTTYSYGTVTFTNTGTGSLNSFQTNYNTNGNNFTLPNETGYEITKGLKMQGDVISFTTTQPSVLTVVQSTSRTNSSGQAEETDTRLRLDGVKFSDDIRTDNSTLKIATFTLIIPAGSHTVDRDQQCGLIFIGVEPITTTVISVEDLCYEHGYYDSDLNREMGGITIEPSGGVQSYTNGSQYQLLVNNNASLTFTPNTDNSTIKIKKVELTLSDNSIITVNNDATGSVVYTNTSGTRQAIVSIKISTDDALIWSKSTPTLTFSPQKVKYNTSLAGVEQNVGNTPDFTLTTSPTAFRLNYEITNSGSGTTINHHLSTKRVGITPGSTKGREVLTASFSGNDFFNEASATLGVSITDGSYEGEYTTTTSTDLYVANGNSIPSAFPGGTVEDGKYLIDGKERNLIGTYTFTEAGPISGGKVISDVPGITMTVGAEGDNNWTVYDNTGGSSGYRTIYAKNDNNTDRYSFTTGCFYKFEPSVNGFLTVNGQCRATNFFVCSPTGSIKEYKQSDGRNLNNLNGDFTFEEVPLVAGQIYYICSKDGNNTTNLFLHSFSFRPAFLDVSVDGEGVGTLSSTETSKSTAFQANLSINKSHFPHLIAMGSAGGSAKFSGDREVVNLYTNNDVDLLSDNTAAANPTLIKGTVMHSNNVDELFTYYFLRSSILTLESINRQARTGTSEGGDPIYGSSVSISNQDYVAEADLENGRLLFHFNSAISRGDGIIQFKAIGSTDSGEGAGNWINITGGWTSISGNNLIVNIGALDPGRTYQIQIASGAVKHSTTSSLMNSEINFMFTVTKSGEAQVEMIYPTGIASVATSIVLQVSTSTGATNSDASDSYTVQGALTGFNDPITAFFDGRNVVFKPAGTLQPNTTYTLTLDPQTYPSTQTIHLKNGETVTTRKEFYFTTGAAIGTVPVVTVKSPVNGAYVDVGSGTISFTFDQDIDLEPYCRVNVIPINGSEAYSFGISRASGESNWTLNKDGRTISFNYGTDGLKYDMYHEVRLPANTVTGVGGKANEETILRFKVNPAPGYTSDVYNFRSKEDYPYTWDMSAMKATDILTIKTYWTEENGGYNRPNMLNCYGKELSSTLDGSYNSNDNQSYQGTGNYTKMDDFRGLRLTTAHDRSARRVRISAIDNASTRCLSFVGNTHYMCIPNVPQSADSENGEHLLYIEASVSDVLALNCPTEMAEWVGDAPQSGDSRRVYKIRVKNNAAFDGFEAYNATLGRDIPLVCSDANIYKIAYSTYNKTLTSGGEGYATDAHDYHNSEITDKGVDYAMTETLAGQTVTPYYVSAISGGSSTAAGTVTLTGITNGVPYSAGVVLIGTAGTTFPVFATSYSKSKVDLSGDINKLIGVTSTVTLEQAASNASTYYYVLNNRYEEVVGGSGSNSEELTGRTGSHIGFYLMRGGESLTINPHAAYFTTDTKQFVQGGEIGGVSAARSVYFFRFEDENGNDITGIASAHEEGVADCISQGDGNYYDLRGQRITRPSVPGIYVRNGKKIYVK